MKKILINETPWQTRVAITRGEELQNIYFSAHATENLERSFFKGALQKFFQESKLPLSTLAKNGLDFCISLKLIASLL